METYVVRYWFSNFENETSFAAGQEITEEDVFSLIRDKRFNIMIVHSSEHSYCMIDDKRFQQR